jgi:hypothetical protein
MKFRKLIQEGTRARLVVGLALLVFHTGITTADSVGTASSARDPSVTRFISYEILGPTNHPFPIVYLSTQHFATRLNEFLAVLPQRRYSVVSEYTQARIARNDCPGKELVGVGYAARITERDKKRKEQCVLQKAMACDYLAGVLQLPGIDWKDTERKRIADFMAELSCN